MLVEQDLCIMILPELINVTKTGVTMPNSEVLSTD
jgi:hypothetical protein